MDIAHIDWIPPGTRFGIDEMAFFVGHGERDIDDALADVDLVVTGPHASAAMPAELQPFVDVRFTRRLQYDFTDVSTSPVARRWAQIDPHVLYIEDPHPRAVRDANRPRPVDLVAGLREAFERLDTVEPESRPSLAGVDAVRPVTFGYLPVYQKPQTDSEWNELSGALATAGELGIDQYERVRDDLIERVIAAKLRRLATIDPTSCSVADWNSATTLDVLSIHDTMNHTARPDGAICLERQPVDRLPAVVAMSNRGDGNGDVIASDRATLRDEIGVPTMRPTHLRAIANAYRMRLTRGGPTTSPSTVPTSEATRPRRPDRCSVRSSPWQSCDRPAGSHVGSVSVPGRTSSYASSCLGPESTEILMQPGTDWAVPPEERVEWLAGRLRHAHDLVRSWGDSLA